MRIHNGLIYAALAIFAVTLSWLAYCVLIQNQSAIYAENGSLENLQVLTLALSCLAFLAPLRDSKREAKLVSFAFFFLCLTFILREVDIETLDVPKLLIALGSGTGRDVILGAGFIGIAIYGALNFSYYLRVARAFLISKAGILVIIAGTLLYIGGYFEDLYSLNHNVFWEEATELSAYMALFLSALYLLADQQLGRPAALPD